MSDEKPNYVKARFGPGETGWAIDLGDGTYKICNSPLDEDLNYGDIVRYANDDTWSNPILVTRLFTGKALIRYPAGREVWEQIVERFKPANEADDVCLEAVGYGMAMLSFKEGFDPVAALVGLENVTLEMDDA